MLIPLVAAHAAPADVDALFTGRPGPGVTRCRGRTVPDVALVHTVALSGRVAAPPARVALYVDGERVVEEGVGGRLVVKVRDLTKTTEGPLERVEQEVSVRSADGAPLTATHHQFDLRWTCETWHYPPMPGAR